MKIGIDGEIFRVQRFGGIPRVFERTMPLIAALDHSVFFCVIARRASEWHVPAALLDRTLWMPQLPVGLWPWRFWNKVSPFLNQCFWRVAWILARTDVFLSTHYTLPPRKMPSVCLVYDMIVELYPEDFGNEFASKVMRQKRLAILNADKVVCISEQTRKDVIRLLDVPERKCSVVHLAAGLDGVDPEPYPSDRPFFLFVGYHVSRYKNFDRVVDSLFPDGGAAFPDYDLVVVSPRQPDEALISRYPEQFANGKIRFISSCSDEVLAGLYASCAAFIYPSLYEGFGLPVLEALLFGAPVICSPTGSVSEVAGSMAYYFDPLSSADLRRALGVALGDGRTPERTNARQAHARLFSWDKTASQLLSAIRDVA